MSLLNRQSRRNTYAQRKKSAAEPSSRQRRSSANRRKTKEAPKKTRRSPKLRLPSVHVSAKGFLRLVRWSALLAVAALFLYGAAVGLVKAWNFCTTISYFSIDLFCVVVKNQITTADFLDECGLS